MLTNNTTIRTGTKTATGRVLKELRGQIIDGSYQPGQVFPTYDKMCEHFGVSRAVLQRVVNKLREDGFIDAVPRSHINVCEVLPHVSRYGLVFAEKEDDSGFVQTYNTMMDSAKKIAENNPNFKPIAFTGVGQAEPGGAVRKQIVEEISNHRLAGLIFGPLGSHVVYSYPELLKNNIPRVFLGQSEKWGTPPKIVVDQIMFYRRALEHLAKQGRKNVAIIHMYDTYGEDNHAELYSAAGLKFHEPWIQYIARSNARNTKRLVQLLFDTASRVVPDGLIIADDNLIDSAMAGLLKVGVRLGTDLDVIAYTQWPRRNTCHLPITRLGYDISAMMQLGIASIRAQRNNEEIQETQFVPAVFENELDADSIIV